MALHRLIMRVSCSKAWSLVRISSISGSWSSAIIAVDDEEEKCAKEVVLLLFVTTISAVPEESNDEVGGSKVVSSWSTKSRLDTFSVLVDDRGSIGLATDILAATSPATAVLLTAIELAVAAGDDVGIFGAIRLGADSTLDALLTLDSIDPKLEAATPVTAVGEATTLLFRLFKSLVAEFWLDEEPARLRFTFPLFTVLACIDDCLINDRSSSGSSIAPCLTSPSMNPRLATSCSSVSSLTFCACCCCCLVGFLTDLFRTSGSTGSAIPPSWSFPLLGDICKLSLNNGSPGCINVSSDRILNN
mmetsp:Transcript_18700/g.32468  ORF Transcript_18700/g.32468 Transcript_18700/m.32468 type:complete len:303 (-) Transcript_18700:955-1863(-)